MRMKDSDTSYKSVAKSMELYYRAHEVIPGATQLISRRPTRYAYGFSPAFAVSGDGGRFIDVDGNCFVDPNINQGVIYNNQTFGNQNNIFIKTQNDLANKNEPPKRKNSNFIQDGEL